jgi:hypothetical protein
MKVCQIQTNGNPEYSKRAATFYSDFRSLLFQADDQRTRPNAWIKFLFRPKQQIALKGGAEAYAEVDQKVTSQVTLKVALKITLTVTLTFMLKATLEITDRQLDEQSRKYVSAA